MTVYHSTYNINIGSLSMKRLVFSDKWSGSEFISNSISSRWRWILNHETVWEHSRQNVELENCSLPPHYYVISVIYLFEVSYFSARMAWKPVSITVAMSTLPPRPVYYIKTKVTTRQFEGWFQTNLYGAVSAIWET